jgi:ribosomal protein RSM22 (predicted rRNA methylase)
MTWNHEKIEILQRLREKFLNPSSIQGSYWDSNLTLEAYDEFFGKRNRWKIDFVLSDIFGRNSFMLDLFKTQKKIRILDWGCGSGAFADVFLSQLFERNAIMQAPTQVELLFFDHSELAMKYCKNKAIKNWGQKVKVHLSEIHAEGFFLKENFNILLLSHVINESLTAIDLKNIFELAEKSDFVLWVESGRKEESDQLIRARNDFLQKHEGFAVLGPCLHGRQCRIADKPSQWCHFNFRPPSESAQDGDWVKIQKILGVDSRFLSVSFCAMIRKTHRVDSGLRVSHQGEKEKFRVLGSMQELKGRFQLMSCFENGELEVKNLPQKNSSLWYKDTQRLHKKNRQILLGQSEILDDKLISGEWIGYEK